MPTKTITALKKGLIQIALLLPIAFGLLLINNPISSAHAQVYPPINTFPQTTFPQANSFASQQAYPYLPPYQTTFPPSVFPPTQSFLPGTSFAVPTGSLSPWFPSVPAVACGGTFSFTIVGDVKNNNNNNNNNNNHSDHHDSDNKKTIAVQIQSAGGTNLDANTISGQLFKGKNNIEHNQGQDFKVRSVSNDCQLTMFSK